MEYLDLNFKVPIHRLEVQPWTCRGEYSLRRSGFGLTPLVGWTLDLKKKKKKKNHNSLEYFSKYDTLKNIFKSMDANKASHENCLYDFGVK